MAGPEMVTIHQEQVFDDSGWRRNGKCSGGQGLIEMGSARYQYTMTDPTEAFKGDRSRQLHSDEGRGMVVS